MSDLAAALKEELVGPDHEHVTTTGISNEKLAMWTFLGSECLLFGGLISTFILYKVRAADGELDDLEATLDVTLGVGDGLAVLGREQMRELVHVLFD